MFLKLSMIIPLAVMMVSDWKTRTVNVVWPAVLFVLAAVDSVVKNGAVTALALWAILRKKFGLDTIPLITFCGIPLILIWLVYFNPCVLP